MNLFITISSEYYTFRSFGIIKKSSEKYISYKDKLTMFNLKPLGLRRIKYNLVLMFKISSNFTDVTLDKITNFLKLTYTRKYNSRKL